MCGIVGIVNGPIKVGSEWITQALYTDALRGWDSTGLIAVREGEVETYKRALPAADFTQTRVYKRMTSTAAQAYIGHNRAATSGTVSDSTAHPFQHGHITGVHNGTLDWGWKDEFKDGKHFTVDSDALIYNIAEEGIEETVKKAYGAFAIVYHDSRNNTLNIVRNKERPMFYGKMNNYKDDKYVFGSEAGLLDWITERTDSGDRIKDFFELKVGRLMTIDLDTQEMTFTDVEVAGRSTYSQRPFHGGSGNWNKSSSTGSGTTKTSTKAGAGNSKPNIVMMPHERQMFEQVGVEVGEHTDFYITRFEEYSNHNSVGVARGILTKEPFTEVLLYGIKKGELKFNTIYASYPVTIRRQSNVKTALGDTPIDELEIVMSAGHVIEIEYDYGDEEDDDPFNQETPWLLADKRPLGPKGQRLSRVEFDKLTAKGCSCCNANILYGVDPVSWTIDGQPLCGDYSSELSQMIAEGGNV